MTARQAGLPMCVPRRPHTVPMAIRVECDAGYRGEETPRAFSLGDRRIEVVEVLDRWLAPNHRYFNVHGDDGGLYIVRHDVTSGIWELTLFEQRA